MFNNDEIQAVKYYYHKDSFIGNIFSACLLIGEDQEILSRGVTICSLLDTFSKKIGRKKSYARAMKAYWSKRDSEMINEDYLKSEYVTRKFKLKEGETIKPSNHLSILIYQALDKLKSVNVYKISKNYPIHETNKFFKFKSEFRPIPTKIEKKLLRIDKND